MNKKQYYVYIMTNQNHTVLYTGVTNDLKRRVIEHRSGKGGAFSRKYKIYKLVYFEKQLKGGSRQKKLESINSQNPSWEDLFEKYFGDRTT